MASLRGAYWGRFIALAVVSLGLLFLFIFEFLPQRFLLELGFSESGYAYPVNPPPLPVPPPPPSAAAVRRPVPRGPAARFWAAYLPLVEARQDSAAADLLAAYLVAHPEDMGATVEHARILWRLGRFAEADSAYREAAARGATELTLELAHLRAAAGDWAGAMALYEELLHEEPGDVELLSEYAEMATWAERYDLAIRLYARLIALTPDDPQLLLQWARVLYWADRPNLAAEVLRRVPTDVAGVDSLAAAIAAALPAPPYQPPPLSPLQVARDLAMRGAADSALAIYRSLLAEDAPSDSLLLEMADVYQFRADAPDRALATLQLYLARHPDDQVVRLRIARTLAWSDQTAAAEATADSIVGAEPWNASAWALLGDMYRWRDDLRGARQAYQRALALDPAEPQAREGLRALDAQVSSRLAVRGTIGPIGRFDYFADSDEYSSARVRAGWSTGAPRTRLGAELELEQLGGYDLSGAPSDLVTASALATAEHWWLEGDLRGTAALGVWGAEQGTAFEPLVAFSLEAPNWGGAFYRFAYRHEPAYRSVNTLSAAVADLRLDAAELEHYRTLSGRWSLSASAGLGYYSGAGDNLRPGAAATLLFRPDDRWSLGYQTLALGYTAPSPSAGGRRLYWDPRFYWLNAAVVGWSGEPWPNWELDARATSGLAWTDERDSGSSLPFQFGATLDARRHWGVWTLAGRAGFGQARTDGYRSFTFDLALSRRFGF